MKKWKELRGSEGEWRLRVGSYEMWVGPGNTTGSYLWQTTHKIKHSGWVEVTDVGDGEVKKFSTAKSRAISAMKNWKEKA